MRNWIARLAILATAIALPTLLEAQHQHDAPSVAGKWTLTVEGGAHGVTTMGLSLKQTGKEVSGTFASPHGDMPVGGEFVDRKLTLQTKGDGHAAEITFNATLKEDDTLSGYISSGMGDMTWTAKRVKDKQ